MVGSEQYCGDIADEKGKENYRFCDCFNINKKLSDHVRKRLEMDGINKKFIYPTIEVNTWEVFQKAKTKEATIPKKKKSKKKRKRTNRQIVEYWLKRKRSKKTRIKRKRRKTH